MLPEFLNLLEERQTARNLSKNNVQAMYAEIPVVHKHLFRRLVSDGMTPNVEDKILYMKENLIKISRHRAMKTVSIYFYWIIDFKFWDSKIICLKISTRVFKGMLRHNFGYPCMMLIKPN